MSLFNAVFIIIILISSFFTFRSFDQGSIPLQTAEMNQEEPSMIPGAQAVRPLAANQSSRIDRIAPAIKESENKAPEEEPVE